MAYSDIQDKLGQIKMTNINQIYSQIPHVKGDLAVRQGDGGSGAVGAGAYGRDGAGRVGSARGRQGGEGAHWPRHPARQGAEGCACRRLRAGTPAG